MEENDISFELRDRRVAGTKISIKLDLKLREKQKKALKALLFEDQGLLVASTGFGKTIVAAALIAERSGRKKSPSFDGTSSSSKQT